MDYQTTLGLKYSMAFHAFGSERYEMTMASSASVLTFLHGSEETGFAQFCSKQLIGHPTPLKLPSKNSPFSVHLVKEQGHHLDCARFRFCLLTGLCCSLLASSPALCTLSAHPPCSPEPQTHGAQLSSCRVARGSGCQLIERWTDNTTMTCVSNPATSMGRSVCV